VIGIVVEGATDKAAVETICRRLRIRCEVRFAKRPGGNEPKAINSLIRREFLPMGADKVIVLKDEKASPGVLETIRRIVRETQDLIETELIVIKPEMEAWLLADPEAVERVLGHRPRIRNPEECENPVDELDRTAMRCGRRYMKSWRLVRRIVEEMDLKRARERCSSLDLFLRKLTS